MKPSGSYAVMAQKRDRDDFLEDFPTPTWGGRALIEHVLLPLHFEVRPDEPFNTQTAWEPAANRGYLSRALREYFRRVATSDVFDYSREPCAERQDNVFDFLIPGLESPFLQKHGAHWIITNPPFRLAEAFIRRSFDVRNWRGSAMLVRTSFIEGVGRYTDLFSKTPPAVVAQFAERVPMVKGRVDPEASTATSYCWLVWMDGLEGTRLRWIPPCRRRLERAGDYDTGAPK